MTNSIRKWRDSFLTFRNELVVVTVQSLKQISTPFLPNVHSLLPPFTYMADRN